MLLPVLLLDIVLALFTLIRLIATCLDMIYPDLYFKSLTAPRALFGPHLTRFFMSSELDSGGRKRTILASYGLVSRRFVLLPIRLGHHVATLAAFVVGTCATDLVHAELAHLDGSLARRAHLCLFLRDSFCHVSSKFCLFNFNLLRLL